MTKTGTVEKKKRRKRPATSPTIPFASLDFIPLIYEGAP